jgi:hypothetical protein
MGIKKVFLRGPEDSSGKSEGRKSNRKDIMLQHHDARTPATAETPATA